MWLCTKDWDEVVTNELLHYWTLIKQDIAAVQNIRIPRYIQLNLTVKSVEVHGFCDASEKAYDAVVYLRILDNADKVYINMIIAKSKIAPLKQVSLPKLELCGAELLSRLIVYVNQIIQVKVSDINAWCDSKIVLAWLRGNPGEWKAFVGNRTSQIIDRVPLQYWNHVRGCDNPADLIFRGSSAHDLVNNTLWWKGPSWLMLQRNWHDANDIFQTTEEARSQPQVLSFNLATSNENDTLIFSFKYFSSFGRAKRVIARCLSWRYKKRNIHIHSFELYLRAESICLRYVQFTVFGNEIRRIQSRKPLNENSKLLMFSPFLDKDGYLRVGGRLNNSSISENAKHPIILPNHHQIGYLIARDLHEANLHAGPTLLTSLIRQRFWILGVRNIVRQIYYNCMVCARYRAKPINQPMGNFPAARVTSSRVFFRVGIDYAGPMQLKLRNGRGRQQLTKGYIALFICLATKAVHIEVVSELSTNAYIQALKRFCSRRGLPAEIHSDNGSNFIAQNKIQFYSTTRAQFREANIKAIKFHLKKAVNAPFTFDDMCTIITQIEALLNSRPLCPLHKDPTAIDVLTPGHFLIGQPLVQLPHPSLLEIRESRLSKWQNLQRRVQMFLHRWSNDYLNQLLQRSKWKNKETTIKINELVLIKDENLPPSMWLLGRIKKVYYGDDGLIRDVTLKTKNGELKRAVNKICKLPLHDGDEDKAELPLSPSPSNS